MRYARHSYRVSFSAVLETCGACAVLAFAALASASAHATVTFEWATVGDTGNVADGTGYGAVSYEYRISKYEVTNAQYAEFLNAVDAAGANPNGIYNPNMGANARGGISFDSGAANGSKYSTRTDMADKPVNYVSYIDAMRFVNWLSNGQGVGGTETGVYNITDGTSETRAANANYFIPTEDEWYKAAYYQPMAQGGDADNYWTYPYASNSSETSPTVDSHGNITNPGARVVNYNKLADWNGQDGNVTTVGSAGSTSYYGTYDQAGNVQEWNETLINGNARGTRGGSWSSNYSIPQSGVRGSSGPTAEYDNLGFRVGSVVPEPASASLLGLGILALLSRRH